MHYFKGLERENALFLRAQYVIGKKYENGKKTDKKNHFLFHFLNCVSQSISNKTDDIFSAKFFKYERMNPGN
jgi:hypothetical protein